MAKDIKLFSNYFIKECGKGTIKVDANNFNNLCVYFIVNDMTYDELMDVCNTEYIELISNKPEIEDKIKPVKFKLLNINEKTFDKDTLESPDHTYQEMHNESVQKYIFAEDANQDYYERGKNSLVRNSIDFTDAQNYYNNPSMTDSISTNPNIKKYYALINEYNINHDENSTNGSYNYSEYFRLGVKTDDVIKNEVAILCDDLQYFENTKENSVLNTGIYGFLITYREIILKPHKKGVTVKQIPMLIYKFAKPTYSNYNKIKLVFNANGLFGVT